MTLDPETESRIYDIEQEIVKLSGKQAEIREKIMHMEEQVGRIDHLETLLDDTLNLNKKLIEQVKANIGTISKILVRLESKSGNETSDS